MAKDYYKTLGVEKSASKDEIKKAFHKLAHQHHPDKKGGDADKFKEINEAYQTLSDDKKRAQYDQFGQTFDGASGFGGGAGQGGFGFDFSGFGGQQGFDMGDIGDIFSEFFGGQRGAHEERRGRDIATEISIPFKDSIFGTEKKIVISKTSYCAVCHGDGGKPGSGHKTCDTCTGKGQINETKNSFFGAFTQVRTCPHCAGTGKIPKESCSNCKGAGVEKKNEEITIKIPAGINSGEMLRVTGMGEAVSKGNPGDLYIKIVVEKHQSISRDGLNLHMKLDIKLSDALLGAEYKINTLDGEIKLKIPEGISPNETLRIRGKGVPDKRGDRGDLMVKVLINIPKKLSKKSKELVEKMKEEGI